MRLTHFIGLLALVLFGLVIGSILISHEQGNESLEQGRFIDGFDFSSVHKVELRNMQGTVTLSKHLEQWQVEQVSSYKADTDKLRKLLQSLKQAQIAQLKTSKPQLFAKLGLAGAEQGEVRSTYISLSNNNKTIEILLGSNEKFGTGQYARWLQRKQALLLDRRIELNTQASSWLDKRIFDVSFDEVRALSWQGKKSGFTVRRAELFQEGKSEQTPQFDTLLKAPEGKVTLARDFELIYPIADKEAKYPSIFTGLVRNTLQLRLQNVNPLNWLDAQKHSLKQSFTVSIELTELEQKDGIQLTFYQTQEQQAWLVVEGRSWAYQIPKHSFQQLAQPLSDYLIE